MKIFGGLLIGIWVARYLGPHDFGIFSYALAFIAFFSWASHLGLNQIIVREISKYPEKTDDILGSAFFMKLIGATLSIGLISLTILFIKPDDTLIRSIVFISSLIYVFQSFDVLEFYFQAKVLSKYTAISKSLALICSSSLKVYFIIYEYSVEYFAFSNVIDIFLIGILYIFFYNKIGLKIQKINFDKTMCKDLLKYSWPLMISSFLISIHMKIDQVMIENMLGLEDVGIYSVATRLSESWYLIPAIIVSTVMPYFIKLRENDVKLYKIRLVQLFSFMFWMGVFVGIITVLIGQEVILFLFGEAYSQSYYALIFSIWGGIFIAQGSAGSIWQIAENLQMYRMYVQLMSVVINIVLNIILINKYGISGAAIATFITYCTATWLFGLFYSKIRPLMYLMIKSTNPVYIILFLKEKINGKFL